MTKSKTIKYFFNIILIFFVLLTFSCSSKYKKAKEALPILDRDFLTSTQYLITKKEKKTFVYLDTEERKAFINDFWKKRDPTPESKENEYKEAYYKRIEDANNLFISSGKNGWLTDRGRTYILFGPPERRDKYPMGYSFYEPPVEVWFYGMFPIIFVDKYEDGSYKIVYSSYLYLQQIAKAEMILHPKYATWNKNLVGKMKIEKSETGMKTVQAEIPYKAIVFHKEKEMYIGTLVLEAVVFANKKKVKTIKKDIIIKITSKEIKNLPDIYNVKESIELESGDYEIKLKITDKSTGKGIFRLIKLNF